MNNCILCNIDLNNLKERIWYADKYIIILDTKERKGHDVRLMILTRKHSKKSPGHWTLNKFLDILKYWKYTDFIIWEGTRAKVSDHWHKVASCICLSGEDNKLKETESTIDFIQTPEEMFKTWKKK